MFIPRTWKTWPGQLGDGLSSMGAADLGFECRVGCPSEVPARSTNRTRCGLSMALLGKLRAFPWRDRRTGMEITGAELVRRPAVSGKM